MRFAPVILVSTLLATAPTSAQDAPLACPDGAALVELAVGEGAPKDTKVVKRQVTGGSDTWRACLVDAEGVPLGRDALTMMGVTVISAGVSFAVIAGDDDRPASR